MEDPRLVVAVSGGLAALAAGAVGVATSTPVLAVVAGAAGVVAAVAGVALGAEARRSGDQLGQAEDEIRTMRRELASINAVLARRVEPARRRGRARPAADIVRERNEQAFDPATGLYDERYFAVLVQQHVAAARRSLRPVSVVIFEIDSMGEADARHAPAGARRRRRRRAPHAARERRRVPARRPDDRRDPRGHSRSRRGVGRRARARHAARQPDRRRAHVVGRRRVLPDARAGCGRAGAPGELRARRSPLPAAATASSSHPKPARAPRKQARGARTIASAIVSGCVSSARWCESSTSTGQPRVGAPLRSRARTSSLSCTNTAGGSGTSGITSSIAVDGHGAGTRARTRRAARRRASSSRMRASPHHSRPRREQAVDGACPSAASRTPPARSAPSSGPDAGAARRRAPSRRRPARAPRARAAADRRRCAPTSTTGGSMLGVDARDRDPTPAAAQHGGDLRPRERPGERARDRARSRSRPARVHSSLEHRRRCRRRACRPDEPHLARRAQQPRDRALHDDAVDLHEHAARAARADRP